MKRCMVILSLCVAVLCAAGLSAEEQMKSVPADEVLKLLKEGNERFVTEKTEHPNIDQARVLKTATEGQHPMATILACSDSREPVELIFDRGVGDLFVLRVAGNVCDDAMLDTMQFGVVSLGTRLCVVMGHTRCGAVAATCTNPDVEHVQHLIQTIAPAVERVEKKTGKSGEEIVELAIKENVFLQMETIFHNSAFLRKAARDGDMTLIGAIYDIETGKVEFLGEHPKKDELIQESPAVEPVTEVPTRVRRRVPMARPGLFR